MAIGVYLSYKDANHNVLKAPFMASCYGSALSPNYKIKGSKYLCSNPRNSSQKHHVDRMVDICEYLFQSWKPFNVRELLKDAPYVEIDLDIMNSKTAYAILSFIRIPSEHPQFMDVVEERYQKYKDIDSYLNIFALSHERSLFFKRNSVTPEEYRPGDHGPIPDTPYGSLVVDRTVSLCDLLKNNPYYAEGSYICQNVTYLGGQLQRSMNPYVRRFSSPIAKSENPNDFDALYEEYRKGYPKIVGCRLEAGAVSGF